MSWQNPKLDWKTNPHNPMPDDFNRIEGNIDFLKQEIETKKGAIVDALNEVGIVAELTDTHAQLAAKITDSNQGTKIITPSTANQAILKGFHSGDGYVVGDPDLIAANIKYDKNIFNVGGTYGKLQDVLLSPQNFSLAERQATLADHLDTINADDFMAYLVIANSFLHDAIIQSATLLPAVVSKEKIWQQMLMNQTALDKILGNATYFGYLKSHHGGLPLFNTVAPNVEFVHCPFVTTLRNTGPILELGDDATFERRSDHYYLYYYIYKSPYLGISTKLGFDMTNVDTIEFEWSGSIPSSSNYCHAIISDTNYENSNPSGIVSVTKNGTSWNEIRTLDVSNFSGAGWFKILLWDGINNSRYNMSANLHTLWLK